MMTLDIQNEQQLIALRQALIEGEQSGDPVPFDFDDFLMQKASSITHQAHYI
ncbi:MAG: hypothetical protein E6Q25_09495 [Acinetobacter sp.]|jgi:Arc/MetJ-type ribon-helix-helix transcriptional regulator|nr:MAG: hypothetical protein E6Q25_09495 [Acinetobacter sp.]